MSHMIARLKSWEGLLLAAFLLIFIFNSLNAPEFLTLSNQVNLFQLSIEKIIVAVVMTFIIINGEIDLSVGSMMGLAACSFGFLVQAGWPAPVVFGFVLLIGAAGGALNGYFITRIGLPSLVVTLSTLIGFRGLARVLVEDRGINGFPDWFTAIAQKGIFGPVPLSLCLFFISVFIGYIILEHTGFGRKTYFIGANKNAADYSGVDSAALKMRLFIASGMLSSLAGLIFAARVGAVRGDVAYGFELDIITIVLLGGVSIFGGVGSMLGTLLSILIVLNLRNGMALQNITGHIQTAVIGGLLILSVILPRINLTSFDFLLSNKSQKEQ